LIEMADRREERVHVRAEASEECVWSHG
jgi:hypothetical protein